MAVNLVSSPPSPVCNNNYSKKCAPDGLQLTIASLNAATKEFSTLAEKMISIADHRSPGAVSKQERNDDHFNSNNTIVNEKEKTERRIYNEIDDITLGGSRTSSPVLPVTMRDPTQGVNPRAATSGGGGQQLEEKLDKLLDSVVKIKVDMHQKIDRLSRRIDQIRLDVQLNIDSTDRAVCNNVLELAGIPHRRGEDLQQYFRRICVLLGYEEADIPLVDIRRKRPERTTLDKTEPSSNSTAAAEDESVITIEFIFKTIRDAFYRAYLRKRTIRLSDLGLESDRRVYINESLTKLNQKLKRLALRKKREGQLHAVYTVDGAVYVQQQPGQKGRRVNSVAELE